VQSVAGVADLELAVDSQRAPGAPRRSRALTAGIVVWLAAVCAGTVGMVVHQTTPGDSGETPERWPETSSLPARDGEPSLLMFVHPHCPCSRASLRELSRLMTRLRGLVRPVVVMIRPDGEPGNWERTDLWDIAEQVVDARVVVDADGSEASRFGAATSGHVVVYDRDGVLRFSGGITAGRSHGGDSAGRREILAWFETAQSATSAAKATVFGCGLFSQSTRGQR
jgi:hypothetical protein